MRLARGLIIGLLVTGTARGQEVTGQQVRTAIERARTWLLNAQGANGQWTDYAAAGGTTALATLALLNAGVKPDTPEIQKALATIQGINNQYTYVVSVKIQALAAANPDRYRGEITRSANWLVEAQQQNGMWGYTLHNLRTDFSNTQFALLGLHEAGKTGVKINQAVWNKARAAWVNSQNTDGGWPYQPGGKTSTGSMTTAGIASLYICGNSLNLNRGRGRNSEGKTVCCQGYVEFRPLVRGFNWLASRFRPDRNPPEGQWYYYYMYGVERTGILSGLRNFGKHDWYREGAAQLIERQRQDGSWRNINEVVDTAFGLLFLAKGYKPLLVNKLQWSNDNAWNMTRNDLTHLLAFIGDKLGEPMSWETVPVTGDLESWMSAPILYFNGQTFPRFDDKQIEQLREYIRQGGTILTGATCELVNFRGGFDQFAKTAFPDEPIIRLAPEHPIFHSLFEVDGRRVEVFAINNGCRTSVIFVPFDIACLWELANVPNESEEAFHLGANIAAYATGLEPLPDKLDAVHLVASSRPATASAPARSAVHIAQLMHNGDWRPNPKAVPNLAEYLLTQCGVDVVPTSEPLAATDPRLVQHPIIYLTGHYSFQLKPDEITALRKHLENGGFLLADACCGRQAFDESFRRLAAALFPDQPLEQLAPTHPVLAGEPGVQVKTVQYRAALRKEQPNLNEPALEGITYEGRTVVIYSRYSLDCGLDGHKCFACRGVEHDDALRLAGNAILYALSY